MSETNLDSLYATNEAFREFVDKNARTYKKTVQEVLDMGITQEYAKYVRTKEENKNGS